MGQPDCHLKTPYYSVAYACQAEAYRDVDGEGPSVFKRASAQEEELRSRVMADAFRNAFKERERERAREREREAETTRARRRTFCSGGR
eukprot:3362942-Alexandrium_andersonii.AAC.1